MAGLCEGETETLSREQIAGALEEAAQRRRGISARELARQYREGHLRCDDIIDLVILASLLSDDDELSMKPAA
jgi:hypothetical protein